MSYRVEISSVAEVEADSAFLSISQVLSFEKARHWYEGLLSAIESLSEMPRRCSLARENDYFTKEIRQLLYGQGRSSYRILFTIVEDGNVSTVRILHIRHSAQRTIGEDKEEPEAT
jgi:plasmid stabilization system protein ParE